MSNQEKSWARAEANRLLTEAGCTYGGAKKGEQDPAQAAFEQSFIRTPTGGKARKR